jgi:UDP-N-acetylmuramate dehydrogenase
VRREPRVEQRGTARQGLPPGLRHDVPLAPWTTLGIGGPARFFLEAHDEARVEEGLAWARKAAVPVFVLGGGSNVLVSDRGFPGLALRLAHRGLDLQRESSTALVRVAAGEDWDAFVAWCVERRLAGVECLSGIPGSVGATPIQNVGAYGQEVSETFVELEALDRESGRRRRFGIEECDFSYRWSVFKGEARDRFVILSVTLRLVPEGAPAVRYPELERYLEDMGHSRPGLAEVREAVLAIRRRKGMVVDPADPDSRSDGSFFLNPVLGETELDEFLARAAKAGVDPATIPRFEAVGGAKLSAAWLIEKAGFSRGLRHGNVGLSTKHALAIVNRGGGTAREVIELVGRLQAGVFERFGVRLSPEPRLIGEGGEAGAAAWADRGVPA